MHSLLLYIPGHSDLQLLVEENGQQHLHRLHSGSFLRSTQAILDSIPTQTQPLCLEDGSCIGLSWEQEVPASLKEWTGNLTLTGQWKGLVFPVFSSVFAAWKDHLTQLPQPAHQQPRLGFITTRQTDEQYQQTDTWALQTLLEHFAHTLWQKEQPLLTQSLPKIPENPHSYEGVVSYVHGALLPELDEFLSTIEGEWAEHFRLAVSMSLGTQAMTFGLYAALRQYQPTVFHTPASTSPYKRLQWLETATLDSRLVDQVLVESRNNLSNERRALVDEMDEWRRVFGWKSKAERAVNPGRVDPFWYRKSDKPVLAVLEIQTEQGPEYIRSCNLEVSLPTGSLCAERNAIGTALSRFPDLRRKQVRRVAILSLAGIHPLLPCGACREWLQKVREVNPGFEIITFEDDLLQKVHIQKL
jgi:cytidine deaminase